MAIWGGQACSCHSSRMSTRERFVTPWMPSNPSIRSTGFSRIRFSLYCGCEGWNAMRPAIMRKPFTAANWCCNPNGPGCRRKSLSRNKGRTDTVAAPILTSADRKDFPASRALQQKAHSLIPGGAHTYAKGDDQYPEQAPGFIVRGKGCHVWDLDGNEFIEYGMGLRAVTLGHAFPRVVAAATRQMQLGTNFVRPAPIEVECAEHFLQLVP